MYIIIPIHLFNFRNIAKIIAHFHLIVDQNQHFHSMSSDRGHIRVDRPHDCKEITITVSTCPHYTFIDFKMVSGDFQDEKNSSNLVYKLILNVLNLL